MDNEVSIFTGIIIYLLICSAFFAYVNNDSSMLTISPNLKYEGDFNFTEVNTSKVIINYELANPSNDNAKIEITENGLHASSIPFLSSTRLKFTDLKLYDGNITCYYDIYSSIENEHFDIEVRDIKIGLISLVSRVIIYVQNNEIHLVSGLEDVIVDYTDSNDYNIGFSMDEKNNYLQIFYNYNTIYSGDVAERYFALSEISYGVFAFYDESTYLQSISSNFIKDESGFGITDVWSFISSMGTIIVWSCEDMPFLLNLLLIKTADIALIFILIKLIRG